MRTHSTQHDLVADPEADRDLAAATLGSRRLLNPEDVAAILGVPHTFVYALARRGEIPTVRIGERYVRLRAGAIDRWIAAREDATGRSELPWD
jgi:excisionase family DNA binding protein